MSNTERGTYDLTIGEKTYKLRLSTNACCELEALFSTPQREVGFIEVLAKVQRSSMRSIRGLMWACLRDFHPELSLTDVGKLIDDAGGAVAISLQLQMLMNSAQPDPLDVEALGAKTEKDPQKARGAGAKRIGKLDGSVSSPKHSGH